ncbi:MAG: xanthine dehydrogenase family protein subunit M [Chloroflexi bacterium]|nr:xanthine dehydrogenase family protein subunit M [Chloroflexota bacterium]
MIPAAFDYQRPASLAEALKIIAADEGAKVLAGGQSLLPLLKLRIASADRLVDIGRLTELRGLRDLPDGGYEVGALTTYADILAGTKLSWVADAVEHIGDVQVRNRGTVGGSIAHCDPSSDLPAVALALDYSAVLRSGRGERVVALDGFFEGPFQTTMEPDELLVAIRRGPLPDGAMGAYRKLAQPASGYSIVGVAAVVALSGGSISHARVALTGVGDVPYRAKAVEDALVGTDGSADAVSVAAEHAADGQTVNGDIHADREYRTRMAVVYTRRAIEGALGR